MVNVISQLLSRAVEIPWPTCPTWSHFIQDKLEISIYLPWDLDLHCFQLSLYLSRKFTFDINTVRTKLCCLCIICPLGQVNFSLDKCIMHFYFSLGKY